ncbi:NupC/NupG family nucleoside CNT transporter [Paraneptunicella aestuarii]|uniref:NupC/NupG family nucleoside CNT transporter n=1 Tax=Paraneptunicella aestuarii TaxID=2831148 RepID=UPI001E4C8EC2|nr:NupC/NupG family nucleoside CNT transporter [Paraneptunicella aestuarii]UAA39395.1 NupC/NupG family nucleoside CNT transporter [Paraneptunicella aestuarii]
MVSLLGVVALLIAAYALSFNRKAINWRTVFGALFIQAAVGLLVLYFPPGKQFLLVVAQGVQKVITYSQEGIDFMFGQLGGTSLGFIFAFKVLPVIIFFSSLISVLYHIGIMSWIIRGIGGFLQRILQTSRPESMNAAANIFVGQTEAPLVVKPFISSMTRSELFALMVGGMASIAGSVMAGYAGLGVDIKYLVAASFMAAPGGLLMAKIVLPETERAKNDVDELDSSEVEASANVFEAAAEGAASGMKIAANVGAMLMAFIALIALLNGLIGGIGSLFGHEDLTFQLILGYLFQPLAWLLGVPWAEANLAGSFIGQKLVVNEFVAYLDFVGHKDSMSGVSQAIVTFALCGFANFSSIAILMGGIGAMAPNRRSDIAKLGLRAVIAASFANLMSAALAGFFISL